MLESEDDKEPMLNVDGSIHIPAGSNYLLRLYSNHGVRVRMVHRNHSQKIPTVRELIERLSKKHEKLLLEEMERSKAEKHKSRSMRNSPLRKIYGKRCSYSLLGENKYLAFRNRPQSANNGHVRSSSSTPTVPYTAADLAYSDVNKQAGDLTTTDLVCFDREKEKNKFREFDASNRQHSGKNNSRRSISLEKVNFDNDKDELRPIKNTFSTNKQNQGRPNGLRGNFIRTDQLLNPKNNVSFQSVGREPEDLIAMGTIWSPNVQQRSSTTTTASTKSLALPPSYNTLAAQPIRKGPNGLTARPLLGSQNQSTSKKEVEPRYSDPLTGAPASFQQRLIELSSLESETIRWERTKKIKKKSKADRDS
ncbi:uncharacterized protein LOC121374232 isoform X2 [Gigantopelta aegis]|uniref:uncharacterized protein LOC121374232 isoform X2 n=2 Tax=Gigantopelta aegis TaxID=1735272 RepID=UPI001B8894F8|nr:uncharacterized protein LOC121374232 isoform X2 [Gigantopelta aegis]